MDINQARKAANQYLQSVKEKKSGYWNRFPKSRDESNLSPEDEVTELTSMNSKLSRYIDRVRHLQGGNTKLTKYVEAVEESQLKESEQMHLMYREKIDQLKKEKEKISRQVSHLGSTFENIRRENTELKNSHRNLDNKIKERDETQFLLEKQRECLNENTSRTRDGNKSTEMKIAEMKQDQNRFTNQLEEIQNKTEKLSGECQKLSERLKINSGFMNQKLTNLKNAKYKEIADAKHDYDGQTRNLVSSFQEKIGNGEDCETNVSPLITKLHTDLFDEIEKVTFQEFQIQESTSKVKDLEVKISNLQREQELLKERLAHVNNMQEVDSLKHQAEVRCKEKEIGLILEKTKKQTEEFQNLLEVKQGLDAEIAVFKKLVETEEDRLGVTKDGVPVDEVILNKKRGTDFTFMQKEKNTRSQMILIERKL